MTKINNVPPVEDCRNPGVVRLFPVSHGVFGVCKREVQPNRWSHSRASCSSGSSRWVPKTLNPKSCSSPRNKTPLAEAACLNPAIYKPWGVQPDKISSPLNEDLLEAELIALHWKHEHLCQTASEPARTPAWPRWIQAVRVYSQGRSRALIGRV